MRNKTRFLPVVVFFVTCVGLWLALGTRLAYDGDLHLLAPRPAMAQHWMCCVAYSGSTCLKWIPCALGSAAGEDHTRPPDEVDWWGRLSAFDPQTPDIRFDFPLGAVTVPVQVSAYRVQELPAGVPPPANGSVGAPFYFGAWIIGQDRPVDRFYEPVVINVGYGDAALGQSTAPHPPDQIQANSTFSQLGATASLPLAWVTYPALAVFSPGSLSKKDFGSFKTSEVWQNRPLRQFASQSGSRHDSLISPSDEVRLRLSMYDPAAQAWVKLCSRVDPYATKVSAALLVPTPPEEGGNALFALVLDDTPALEQAVDEQGNTTLFVPEDNFSIKVLAGTVEVGTHFEITRLPEVLESDLYKLLPTPLDIKACQADYTEVNRIRQLTQFPKPMTVAFDYDPDTITRAGGRTNLTIAGLQDRRWVDLEEFGFSVARGDTAIAVDTNDLGTFSLAVR